MCNEVLKSCKKKISAALMLGVKADVKTRQKQKKNWAVSCI